MRWIGVATAVVALALVGAGCGGSSGSDGEAAADTTAIETSASTEETMTDEMMTETATETSGGMSGLSDECKDLVEAGQSFAAAAASAGGGTGDDLDSVASAYAQLAEQAPDDLKDDFTVLAEVMTEYAAAIGDLDLTSGEAPSADQIAKLTQLGQSFSAEKVQKASAAIAAWSTANCGANG